MSDDVTPFRKSNLCDYQNKQERAEKSTKGSGSAQPKNKALEIQIDDNQDTVCLDTSICSAELEDLPWQPSNLGEYKQPSLLKSTPMHNQSCDRISQESPFTQILETTTQSQDNLTSSPAVSPALAQVTQEVEQDSNIQRHHSGEKDLDALLKFNPASVLSSSLKGLSDEDFELFLGDSLWLDTLGRLATSRQQSLGRVIKDSDYLSFPTLTSNESSTSRPAGQNKCEKWFKDNGLIKSGYQLGTRAIALTMGFPSGWFEGLTEQYSKNLTTPSQVKPQAELEQDISQDAQLHQHKQRSPSAEFSISTVLLGGKDNSPLSTESSSSVSKNISIPCLVKQPKQPEVKGFIRKDQGDFFLVEVDGEEISVSKLFVYPDFSTVKQHRDKSVEQIPPTKQATPPSKIKTRRKKGDGTGYIYRRTIFRRGKQYQEAYFRYRDESGKLKAKYIPQRLLDKVQEAESLKKPIADILFLLGGDGISRGEQSSTLNDRCVQKNEKTDELISISRGERATPPSNKKRKQGEGTGYIECKPIKRSGKEYKRTLAKIFYGMIRGFTFLLIKHEILASY